MYQRTILVLLRILKYFFLMEAVFFILEFMANFKSYYSVKEVAIASFVDATALSLFLCFIFFTLSIFKK
jgi:hypothetical protein